MPANKETTRLATEFRREMGGKRITIKALADMLTNEARERDPDASAINEMWVSRRVNGTTELYSPPQPARLSPDVLAICQALDISLPQLANLIGITLDDLIALLPDNSGAAATPGDGPRTVQPSGR